MIYKRRSYPETTRTVNGVTRELTDFICESAEDIGVANADGSEYLLFPVGSIIYDGTNKKAYMLVDDEYKEQ